VNWAVVIVTKALHRHDVSHFEVALGLGVILKEPKGFR
jgi:hypothetical protein